MPKDDLLVSGERVLRLRQPVEKMSEFADRLGISLRTLTELVKPGQHRIRIDTLDEIAESLGLERIEAYFKICAEGKPPNANNEHHGVLHWRKMLDALNEQQKEELYDELKKMAARKRKQ